MILPAKLSLSNGRTYSHLEPVFCGPITMGIAKAVDETNFGRFVYLFYSENNIFNAAVVPEADFLAMQQWIVGGAVIEFADGLLKKLVKGNRKK